MPELIDVDEAPVEREPGLPPSPAPDWLDWLRRDPKLSPRLRRLLEVQQVAQPEPPVRALPNLLSGLRRLPQNKVLRWAPILAPGLPVPLPFELQKSIIHFGMGLVKGAVATVKRVRDPWGYGDVPEPRGFAEQLGYGLTSPLEPSDPMAAAVMAFPPGSVIERGLSEAVGAVGRAYAGAGVRSARQAAARAPGLPGAARLRIAGVPPARGAAVPPGFGSEREALEHLNGLLDDLDNVQAERAGLTEELAAAREMRAAKRGPKTVREAAQRQKLQDLEVEERNLESQTQELIARLQAKPVAPTGVELPKAGAAEPPPPGAGGVPPVATGGIPPTGPPGAPPTKPGTMTASIAQHLLEAQAIVARDRMGTISRILDFLPGTRQATRYFIPAHAMKDSTLVGWVAEGRAIAVPMTKATVSLRGQRRLLEAAFGKGLTAPEHFKPAGVKFIGTAEQRAVNKAAGDLTGELWDILERPALYELSDARRNAIRLAQESRSLHFDATKTGYGLDIRAYPTQPGGMHLAHVDASDDAIAVAGSLEAALRRGRAKERFYATIAERMRADPTFVPVTSVAKLLMADDANLARMAGRQTFLLGSGGLTRLEVMEKVRPDLANKMAGLKKRLVSLQGSLRRLDAKQAEAIDDFLASPLEETAGVRLDLTELQAALNPSLKTGPRKGQNIRALEAEIRTAKQELEALRPEWRTANLKPYAFVKEGAFHYYPADEADQVRRLMERSHNRFLEFLDQVRATAFGGDLSPITIQGLTLWFADPIEATRLLGKGRALVSANALEADMLKNAESWGRFTAFTSINPLGGVGQEFATGYVAKLPKVGPLWERWNEDLYRPLVWGMKQQFDLSEAAALRRGLSAADAGAVAADDATKIIPRVDFRRLGWSEAEMARYRAALTSVSFLTQPAALMNDAAKGLLKLGLRQTITPTERFAVQRVLTLVATVEALSVGSNVWYAKQHGLDIKQAALEALNPASGKFMSLILLNGSKIRLGGPYRAIIMAIRPQKVKIAGVKKPVLLPFVGLERFAQSKLGPGFRVLYDLARDRDYNREQIRMGEFPVNVLRGLEYAFRGGLPLTAGEAMKGLRQGKPLGELLAPVVSQFAGANYVPETLGQLENRIAAEMFPIDPKKEPWRQREPYWALTATQRKKVDAHPLVKIQRDAQKDYRGVSFEAVRATEAQFHDGLRTHNESAKASYVDLAKRWRDTAAGKMKGDRKALSPRQFRKEVDRAAMARRKAIADDLASFAEFEKNHPQKDYEELNPDARNRERFLVEFNNYEDFLDRSTGSWDYKARDYVKARWEQMHGVETVRRWLKEGDEDIPPEVRRLWDGREKYRDYFTVRDVVLARASPQVQAWLKKIDEAELEHAEAGRVEALKRNAPPGVAEFKATILKIKKAMRRTDANLDRWLFDYDYTLSTLAEQEAREK